MSAEDTVIASVIFERNRMARSSGLDRIDTNEARKIERYGRKMIRLAEANRITSQDSDEKIAKAITPVMAWLFWQIAPELLLWIVRAIRHRIWANESQASER
jgi:hypothetical protein